MLAWLTSTHVSPLLSSGPATQTNNMTVSLAGQRLPIIQLIIMTVSMAGQQKNKHQCCFPLLANNYLSSRLSPLLPSTTRQHHCCLPRWPAITCHSTYHHGCLHSWQAAITSSVVSIAGQQPPTTMVVSIAEQQPLTHHRPCPHGWQAAMSFHNCIHY